MTLAARVFFAELDFVSLALPRARCVRRLLTAQRLREGPNAGLETLSSGRKTHPHAAMQATVRASRALSSAATRSRRSGAPQRFRACRRMGAAMSSSVKQLATGKHGEEVFGQIEWPPGVYTYTLPLITRASARRSAGALATAPAWHARVHSHTPYEPLDAARLQLKALPDSPLSESRQCVTCSRTLRSWAAAARRGRVPLRPGGP